jgi:Tfp pilus assembly protein FimT
MQYSRYTKGLSAIELLVVIGVVVLLAVITVPSLMSLRRNQALQNSVNATVSLIQEARTKSLASYNNTFYSVYIDTTQAVLFTGGTYNAGDVSNKVVPYETPITLQSLSLQGGGSSIQFDRLKGTTAQHGTLSLGINGGESRTITVSASGLITRE